MQATCLKFIERNAIIKLQTGHIIEWPIAALPESINTGDSFTFTITTPQEITQAEIKAKQKILHELIN